MIKDSKGKINCYKLPQDRQGNGSKESTGKSGARQQEFGDNQNYGEKNYQKKTAPQDNRSNYQGVYKPDANQTTPSILFNPGHPNQRSVDKNSVPAQKVDNKQANAKITPKESQEQAEYIQQLENKLKQNEDDLFNLYAKLDIVTDELTKLTRDHKSLDAVVTRQTKVNNDLYTQKEALLKENKDLTTQVKQLLAEIHLLREQLTNLKQQEQLEKNFPQANDSEFNKVEELTEENRRLNDELKKSRQKQVNLNEFSNQLKQSLESNKTENNNLKSEIARYEKDIKYLTTQIEGLTKENQQLKQSSNNETVKTLQNELKEKKNDYNILFKKFKELDAKYKVLDIPNINKKTAGLELDLKKRDKEIEELNIKLAQLEKDESNSKNLIELESPNIDYPGDGKTKEVFMIISKFLVFDGMAASVKYKDGLKDIPMDGVFTLYPNSSFEDRKLQKGNLHCHLGSFEFKHRYIAGHPLRRTSTKTFELLLTPLILREITSQYIERYMPDYLAAIIRLTKKINEAYEFLQEFNAQEIPSLATQNIKLSKDENINIGKTPQIFLHDGIVAIQIKVQNFELFNADEMKITLVREAEYISASADKEEEEKAYIYVTTDVIFKK